MALIIKASFHADVPRNVAWDVITDIERSAPCFPGAELGEREADGSYKGAFNVKLGPLAFRFAGKFGFVEKDPANGSARISASGTDTKGRGGAQAMVDVVMVERDGRTEVQITSDVVLSGSVAQYGRGAGMIQALSQQLINQFARNLSAVMAQARSAAQASAAAQPAASVTPPAADTAPLAAPARTAPPAASLNAGSLVWHTLMAWLRKIFTSSGRA
jgi:carbon monoxide dehydrogenase subunit G